MPQPPGPSYRDCFLKIGDEAYLQGTVINRFWGDGREHRTCFIPNAALQTISVQMCTDGTAMRLCPALGVGGVINGRCTRGTYVVDGRVILPYCERILGPFPCVFQSRDANMTRTWASYPDQRPGDLMLGGMFGFAPDQNNPRQVGWVCIGAVLTQ